MQSSILQDMVKRMVKNRKDLLKAIHYVVLLMSSEDNDMLDDAEENEIDDIENDYIENEMKKEDTNE